MTAEKIQRAVDHLRRWGDRLPPPVLTLLAAYDDACRERDRLREACRLIVSGWGHQDGVSRAVAAARAALGEE